jgi:hypothetical protein
VTDDSLASGDLEPIQQWLVVNRQFLAREWFPFSSITSCLEDGSERKGTSLTTSCCGVYNKLDAAGEFGNDGLIATAGEDHWPLLSLETRLRVPREAD